ncbi:MAG: hypothetical protein CO090_06285 [Acidobacteria bacterium CG_4_9_14_3_um_filter_49_7]|nr:MAG: hypothetical protein CO090_06285 [Acidobacteria bacterium CG_4_9_14_3_um_filter_49_7]
MRKPVLFNKKPNQPLEVDICAISDWEGFDKLIQFLKKEYFVDVISQIDGPGARRWILKARGKEFELRHDDGYGNYLFAPSLGSEKIVRAIGKDLESRLKNI